MASPHRWSGLPQRRAYGGRRRSALNVRVLPHGLYRPASTEADRADATAIGIQVPQALRRGSGAGLRRVVSRAAASESVERFAGDDDDTSVMVYPRSAEFLQIAARIAARSGWKVIAFATERPSARPSDAAATAAYVEAVRANTDGVCTVCEELAAYWIDQGVDPARITVIPTPVREACFTDSRTHTGPGANAVYIGNLEHERIEYLYDAAEVVRESVPDLKLTFYADSSDQRRLELLQEAERRCLNTTIELLPAVSPIDVPNILRDVDVHLVPPRNRGRTSAGGFPMKLGECLASGRPVVAPILGDIPKYLVDGESAFLVPPQDTDAFAAAVVKVLPRGSRARRASGRARPGRRATHTSCPRSRCPDSRLPLDPAYAQLTTGGRVSRHDVPPSGDRDVPLVQQGHPTFRPLGVPVSTGRGHAAALPNLPLATLYRYRELEPASQPQLWHDSCESAHVTDNRGPHMNLYARMGS